MIIIPSIDLYQGQVVRLKQGKFDKVEVFSSKPHEVADSYSQMGVKQLHVVDLDGAKTGRLQQLDMIHSLSTSSMQLQLGGGIRSLDSAFMAIDAGISKIVIGSLAITDPDKMRFLMTKINPEQIVLALDVHIDESGIPSPAIHGWQKAIKKNAWDILEQYRDAGIQTILCTDIAQDGMMQGPNFALYSEAIKRFPTLSWQASGGIRNRADLKKLSELGLTAAILGRALYEKSFDLMACLEEFAPC